MHILQKAAETQRFRVPFFYAQSALGVADNTSSQGHHMEPFTNKTLHARPEEGHFNLVAILGSIMIRYLLCSQTILKDPSPGSGAAGSSSSTAGRLRAPEHHWQVLHVLAILWHKRGRVPWKALHSPGFWFFLVPKIFIARAKSKF